MLFGSVMTAAPCAPWRGRPKGWMVQRKLDALPDEPTASLDRARSLVTVIARVAACRMVGAAALHRERTGGGGLHLGSGARLLIALSDAGCVAGAPARHRIEPFAA